MRRRGFALAHWCVLVLGLSCGWKSGLVAQEVPLVAPGEALSPQEQQKLFRLPPGFEIQLIASEPEIQKPMNMAFDAAGRLREHYPLHPFDETSVASRADDLQFAVEVNQGWFRANQVKRGALLDLKALADALRQRGFDPAVYGLKPKPSP